MIINRREFLKRAYQTAGIAGLYAMGGKYFVDKAFAKAMFISGHTGVVNVWAGWDESSESGLASDDTFVCIMTAGHNQNEIGMGGGLTGDNLILTQNGGILGVSGGRRQLDGADDFFSVTTALMDTLISNANKTWTIVVKGTDIESDGANANYLAGFIDSGDAESIGLRLDVSKKLTHFYEQDNGGIDFTTVTTAQGTTTEYYTMIWSDGTEKVRLGYATAKPTKWSDFATTARAEVANAAYTGDFSGETWDGTNYIGTLLGLGTGCLDFKLEYVVFSKTCFIDNAS